MPTQEHSALPAIALVAEHASLELGRAASRPLHYFKLLRARGLDVHLVTSDQHRAELSAHFQGDLTRLHCVPDSPSAAWITRASRRLPGPLRRVADALLGAMRQRGQRRLVSQLVHRRGVRIVHQVTPCDPRQPSRIHNLGVPVVMGPLTRPPELPPGFRGPRTRRDRILERQAQLCFELLVGLGHLLLPGRRQAEVLLVSDARSSRCVPATARGRKLRLAADGVEIQQTSTPERDPRREIPVFVFAGQLVDCHALDPLLDAFRLALDAVPARLRILGDGPLRARLERRCRDLDLDEHVEFCGQLDLAARRAALEGADALIDTMLGDRAHDALMEAMGLGLPVVAPDWGMPSCLSRDGAGLLVGPRTPQQFTHELANAIHRLAASGRLRHELGQRGRKFAHCEFDWQKRVDRLLDVYRLLLIPSHRTPRHADGWRRAPGPRGSRRLPRDEALRARDAAGTR